MADKDNKQAAPAGKDAKDGKPAAAAAAAPATAKGALAGKKKLILIGTVAALLLVGGSVAAWSLSRSSADELGEHDDGKGEHDASKKPKRKKGAVPVFVDLETFTANLRDADEDRFIQVKLVAEVANAPAGEMLKTLMPSVRNEILLLLSSKESKDLATRDGKEKLAAEIVAAANHTLADTSFAGAVQGVNFTHIIVQ